MSVKILTIDTSTDYGSVALTYGDEILHREVKAPKQHSLKILSMIDVLLHEASIQKSQLDAIGFGRGPGSFTGIRLATSIAQASAFGLNIPVISISTLQALAQQAFYSHQCDAVLPALDARLSQVYWGCYQIDEHNIMQLCGEERLDNPAEVKWSDMLLNQWKGFGSGWDHYSEHLKGEWIAGGYPNAYNMAVIARDKYQKGELLSAANANPFYLRDQVVQVTA